MEMDKNGNFESKWLTSCWSDSLVRTMFFCASGHDTYAYRMSLMYVHLGGGAWIFNIPGGAIESTGNTFLQISSGGHWQ